MRSVTLSPPDPKDTLDLDDLRERAGGDEDLVLELLGDFLDRTAEMTAIAESAAADEFDKTSRLAHRLKGSLLALGARAAARSAAQLEHQASAMSVDSQPAARELLAASIRVLDTRLYQACASMRGALSGATAVTPRMSSGWR